MSPQFLPFGNYDTNKCLLAGTIFSSYLCRRNDEDALLGKMKSTLSFALA